MNERVVRTEYTTDIPNILELVSSSGSAKAAAELLGLSDLSFILRENKARPAYEMAAAYILSKNVDKGKILVLRVKAGDSGVTESILTRLGIEYSEVGV